MLTRCAKTYNSSGSVV